VLRVHTPIIILAGTLLCLGGCEGEGILVAVPTQIVTQILSNPTLDGDIEQTGPGAYTVTQGMSATVQSVLAGIDPQSQTEFRAFLNFDLTGSNGVPGNAVIDSAFVELLIDNVLPTNGTLPVRVELVSFQPPTLIGTDFDTALQPPLAAALVSGNVTSADIGQFVAVDVTALLVKAQQLGLVEFQLRVMENVGPPNFTLMEIDDSTASDRAQRAPLLTVTYR
jgi:hypothetical protein